MASLSGCIGWPITGDKTIEFAKNPNEFVQSKIDTFGCRVFQTRVLNRAHVFVASSRGVKEILQGIKIYLFQLSLSLQKHKFSNLNKKILWVLCSFQHSESATCIMLIYYILISQFLLKSDVIVFCKTVNQ